MEAEMMSCKCCNTTCPPARRTMEEVLSRPSALPPTRSRYVGHVDARWAPLVNHVNIVNKDQTGKRAQSTRRRDSCATENLCMMLPPAFTDTISLGEQCGILRKKRLQATWQSWTWCVSLNTRQHVLHGVCWWRTRQLTPSPWRSSTGDLTTQPRGSWRVARTAWGWWGMREGSWKWWRRGQGSQRKRSLLELMRWDKHSDILSHAMCAKNECVHQVCDVIVKFHVLCVDLGFHVVIGVGRLTVQHEGFTRQLHFTTHTQFQVQSSFLRDVVVRLCPVIVNSIWIPNSCIFHIAKTGLLRCCLYTLRRLQ